MSRLTIASIGSRANDDESDPTQYLQDLRDGIQSCIRRTRLYPVIEIVGDPPDLQAMRALVEAMYGLRRYVRHLHIRPSCEDPDAVECLLDAIVMHPEAAADPLELESIVVVCKHVGEEGMSVNNALARLIENCRHTLESIEFGPPFTKTLVAALRESRAKKLRVLVTGTTRSDFMALAGVLESVPITAVNFGDEGLSLSGLRTIRGALKHPRATVTSLQFPSPTLGTRTEAPRRRYGTKTCCGITQCVLEELESLVLDEESLSEVAGSNCSISSVTPRALVDQRPALRAALAINYVSGGNRRVATKWKIVENDKLRSALKNFIFGQVFDDKSALADNTMSKYHIALRPHVLSWMLGGNHRETWPLCISWSMTCIGKVMDGARPGCIPER
jgi:hypothetical protein